MAVGVNLQKIDWWFALFCIIVWLWPPWIPTWNFWWNHPRERAENSGVVRHVGRFAWLGLCRHRRLDLPQAQRGRAAPLVIGCGKPRDDRMAEWTKKRAGWGSRILSLLVLSLFGESWWNSDGCYCNYVVPLPINYPRRVPVLPNCLLQACSWPRLGKKHGNGRFPLSSNFYNAFVGFFPVNGGFNVNLIYK